MLDSSLEQAECRITASYLQTDSNSIDYLLEPFDDRSVIAKVALFSPVLLVFRSPS